MKLFKLCLPVCAILLLVGFTINANALTFDTYTSRAAWEAALNSFLTEDFEAEPDQTANTSGDTFTLTDFEIDIDVNHDGIQISGLGAITGAKGFYGDVHGPGASFPGGDPLFNTINFFRPISAFGADFGEVDEGGLNNVSIAGSSFSIPNGSSFFGVITGGSFSTVDIRTTGSTLEFYQMDNVSFNPVPEPSTMLLLGSGLIGLAGFRRKRNK